MQPVVLDHKRVVDEQLGPAAARRARSASLLAPLRSRVGHRSVTQKRCPGLGCSGEYAYHSNDEDEDDHRNDSDTSQDESDSDNDRAREDAMGRERRKPLRAWKLHRIDDNHRISSMTMVTV